MAICTTQQKRTSILQFYVNKDSLFYQSRLELNMHISKHNTLTGVPAK